MTNCQAHQSNIIKGFIAIVILIPLCCVAVIGQEIVSAKPLIRYLLSDSTEVYDITVPKLSEQPLIITDIPFLKGNRIIAQKLIRNRSGLFVLPDATGRVYEIKENGEKLIAQRIDSTIFFGYNFGAFAYTYRDTIYSYGGYGIWRYNGQLRVYVQDKNEWELIPLLREIPFYSNDPNGFKAWFDNEKGHLYVNKMPEQSNASDSIFVLDMHSKKWTLKGKIVMSINHLEGQINTPWGILFKGNEDYTSHILLNLKENRIFYLSEKKSAEITNREQWNSNFLFKDSSLFIAADSLYKISLSFKDFRATDQKIYEEEQTTLLSSMASTILSSWKIITGMIACLFIGFLSAHHLQKTKIRNHFRNGVLSKKTTLKVFDEKEKELINLIYINSTQKKSTSIDDINKVLGLADKASDLQKKHRSDTITSINQKYQYITKQDGLLLKKYRSEVDKRSFEYFIDYEDYKSLESIL